MLPDFQNAKILVVGDVMLDRYWHGKATRISPEAPVPVVKVNEIEERLGGAANVALNLASLGCEVALLGCIGDDEPGGSISKCLSKSNISDHLLLDNEKPTITKLRIISQQQQLIRLDFEEKFEFSSSEKLKEKFEEIVEKFDVVIFSDYDKGTLANVSDLIAIAKASARKVIIDPKGSDFEKYQNADLLTPNAGEFELIAGTYNGNAELEVKARDLLSRFNLEAILITRGEHGMSLVAQDYARHIPALAREVFDVTGAGDTVISVFAAAQACDQTLEESAELANVAAGIVVGKLGTATVTESELSLALKQHEEHELSVVSKSKLMEYVADARLRGEKIVMTNGCFDILHAGHVTYLEHARKLGDRLIVAVNSDESVRKLKGSSRPIVPLDERMAVLAGLSSVDWLVPFYDETPELLICEVLPDVLVKGGDYVPEDIAGSQCVYKNDGEVRVLNFVDGCSTTNMINRILNKE